MVTTYHLVRVLRVHFSFKVDKKLDGFSNLVFNYCCYYITMVLDT